MSLNWNAPLFVAGTNRPATIVRPMQSALDRLIGRTPTKWTIRADWNGDGLFSSIFIDANQRSSRNRVSNAATYTPPPAAVDPKSPQADALLGDFFAAEGNAADAAKARAGQLRDNRYHRLALFVLNAG